MRKYLRQVAKARMKAVGVDRVNRRMSKNSQNGKAIWREFLWGEFAAQATKAQIRPKLKRKIRKIEQTTG